ncbi:modulator of macroautophagy TMEM150B [Cyclopterus lumpus]|uniref:Transmembrane protein 150B n=1 Tax=Cyclopterus lumpus TaxID=8103 RepID=A0A8C2ZDI0_CYCLU|nr:modulator of macroautophagy TMEM150B [Cyclopterus lumpus]
MWMWALLPVCLAVFGTVGIWTVLAVAVSNGSVNLTEGVPYISKCGTYPPQSCLFSQICSISSVLALWIVAIRFQQIRDCGNHGKANAASVVLGFISSIGISIIGNFQQSILKNIHHLGVFLAFFLGLAYFWVQLFLTYRAPPSPDRCWVGPARATCCILCTILVIAMVVLHNTGSPSWAAVCEWALVMLVFCLFGLFAAEFRHIDCHQLTVQRAALADQRNTASLEVNGYVANAL